MRQHAQHHFLLLILGLAGTQRGALIAFDHAVRRLALGSLSVLLLIRFPFESFGHVSSRSATGRLARRAADARRDDRPHAQVLSRDAMIIFRIITRIRHRCLHVGASPGVVEQIVEVRRIRAAADAQLPGI